ncbi:MAG: hypothetical protein A3C90_04075 [Candidatus Magasanikbacteria bacterium RIFCSPHIGHO2_02_FULL_51_14]|uniref:Uncharacterized protein n=1 Tax=Candidatus Magasanikbacteria bacterium RIFCSPHIGHO2_02_FULL_51_14 TaxID=1798683 RepID=A0A1F6MDI9_9BACT|nr:MAG: hypothetical protein A3C90_04075 [Candidatus Magasanikbacteria bacterium RIFCSPHIGHO2_02_FULL_51_14]
MLALGVTLVFVPLFVFAQDYGLRATAEAALLYRTDTPAAIAGNVIGAGLSMIGVLFFILMVYAGILWMTARGNEETTKKALNTAIAAGIGMVIVLASYAITNFVFRAVESGELGGGGGGGATECQSQGEGFDCRNIDDCRLIFAVDDDEASKLARCENTPNYCKKGLCPEGATNVCCIAR